MRWPPGPRTTAPTAGGAERDDTAWLQARLDRSAGTIFLPKLPNDTCYATRGLWVSHDRTTITSDGACIVSLGLGPVRPHSIDGDPIAASAVFFVNRSKPSKPAPVGVTISNLKIVVPDGQSMYGVAVFGHQITLSHLDIGGAPKDARHDQRTGQRQLVRGQRVDPGLDAQRREPERDLRHRRDRAAHRAQHHRRRAGLAPGQPAAGIDIEPDDRGQPALDVHIVGNTIRRNAGPGVMLELESNDGPAVVATNLEISGNTIVENALKRSPPKARRHRPRRRARMEARGLWCSRTTPCGVTVGLGSSAAAFVWSYRRAATILAATKVVLRAACR